MNVEIIFPKVTAKLPDTVFQIKSLFPVSFMLNGHTEQAFVHICANTIIAVSISHVLAKYVPEAKDTHHIRNICHICQIFHKYIHILDKHMHVCMQTYMGAYVYVYIYTCLCIYLCIYVCM